MPGQWVNQVTNSAFGTGCGSTPTRGNVHEIAKQVIPAPRVVYVDNDPIVAAHGRALLASDHTTTIITADAPVPGASAVAD